MADKRDVSGLARWVGKDVLSQAMGDKNWDPFLKRRDPDEVRENMRSDMERAENISNSVPRRAGGGRVGSDKSPMADQSWKRPYSSAARGK